MVVPKVVTQMVVQITQFISKL